jgi:hypothetical protein
MTALAASGRRYEALAVFDRLREALAEEYAADPEPATRRLYRDLLTRGAEPDTPAAAGAAATGRAATACRPARPTAWGTARGRSRPPSSAAGASWPGSARPSAAPGCSP